MKVDILAVGVHPDDIELSCAGTLLKHIELGYTVGILDLTQGELGTRGNAAIRRKEALASAKIMGAKFRKTMKLADGLFEGNAEDKLTIIRAIRHYQPDIVLANALSDRHPDHGRAAKLTADACYLAGLMKIKTREKGRYQEHWRPRIVYHYVQDYNLQPDLVVDITEHMDKKIECIQAFKSQFFDPDDKSGEPSTPISGEDFFESVKAKNRVHGRFIGVRFGEGYNVARPIGVGDLIGLV